MTNAEQERKIFWEMFENELNNQGNPFHIAYRHQYATINRRSSTSDNCVSMDFLVQKHFLRLGVYMRDNIPAFEYLYANKASIESELGFEPTWVLKGASNPNTRRIEICFPFSSYNRSDYQRVIEKAIPYAVKFIKVIPKYSPECLFDF